MSLNNLAGLYQTQGDYAKAVPLFKRSLAIREKALGPDHPDVAMSLNNLAGLYQTQGDYAKAVPLYRRALAITEKALGPDHLDVATNLNNLAGLYKTQGDYAKGERRKRDVKQYGFHSLRHAFVTAALDAGVSLGDVQLTAGHGSPVMTQHYSHSLAAARRVMSKLPSLAATEDCPTA
jgi:tetratricopeptide (TPR) repeat protein